MRRTWWMRSQLGIRRRGVPMASCLSQSEIVVKRLPKARGVAAHNEQAA
jgi:hypothetical protein